MGAMQHFAKPENALSEELAQSGSDAALVGMYDVLGSRSTARAAGDGARHVALR